MSDTIKADIAVIGGGAGGLAVAAGAAQLGASVVLAEKAEMGGDCLNFGCVPSKALIAAAHAAETVRASARFGINGHEPEIDFAAVNAHVKGVIAAIAPHDSVERFEGLGVRVIQTAARFTGPREFEAGGTRVQARRFVIATGSRAGVPPIPGLDDVPYLTNETVFELTTAPEHLIIIGGGPIGMELAQAHRRLGARVTVLEAFRLMGREDPDLAEVVIRRLAAEDISLREGVRIAEVARLGNGVRIEVEGEAGREGFEGSHLLVAAGRKPNLEGLGLDAAGIVHTDKGIEVDDRLRTSNRRVFAIGDVAGGAQFTHMAGHHAGIVIRNALFRMPAKARNRGVPRVTYTDPEIAHAGLSEAEARATGEAEVRTVTWSFEENDRARAERETEGLVKVVLGRRGRILGAGIVGPRAGELIAPWVLGIEQRLKIGAIADMIVPYPTLAEVSKRAAGASFTEALFSPRTKKLVFFMSRLG